MRLTNINGVIGVDKVYPSPLSQLVGIGCEEIVFTFNDFRALLDCSDGALRANLERLQCRFLSL